MSRLPETLEKKEVLKEIDAYISFAKKKEKEDETLNAIECLANLKEDIKEL